MTTKPLSVIKIQKIAFLIFVSCIAVLGFFYHYILDYSWMISMADSIVSNMLLALCCILISTLLGYYQPKNEPVLFVFVLTLILALFVTFFCNFILTTIFEEFNYIKFLNSTLSFRFLFVFTFLAWCALANILWYRLEEQSEMQQRLFTTQSLAKEAELNKLRHQLQPHFLFNSLNSVYALTIVNPKEAGIMITKLASFLRGTLKRDDEVWVSIAEEMEYIQLYLDIEKVRFSHRLNLDIKVEKETLNLYLPGTLLQPIVENSIKFGLYNTSGPILISIVIKVNQNVLEITINNPYDNKISDHTGTGFGLSSIRRRLYLLFADNTLLQTHTVDETLFVTTLKIPQKDDKNNTN